MYEKCDTGGGVMLAYYGTEISPNQTETVEGYLICRNVPIARTGRMAYMARELQLEGDPERVVEVERHPEDVFEAATLASFEGKPVTDGHPPESVGPENYGAYARGHVQNVRREGDFIVADLHINDAALASDVRNGVKREVSCGYLCTYMPERAGYKQTHIRGNHVAVVPKGRAGHEVAIQDAAGIPAEKGMKHMKKETKEALCRFFGLAARDAEEGELEQLTRDAAAVLDAGPAQAAQEAEPTADGMGPQPAQGEDLGGKLDRVIAMLQQLAQKDESGKKQADEGDIDELIHRLSGGEGKAATVQADESLDACGPDTARDSAVALLKAVRPAVASIQNRAERARVADALLAAVQGPGRMEDILRATQLGAQKAADAAGKTNYEQVCADQKAAYDARNPHKNHKEV